MNAKLFMLAIAVVVIGAGALMMYDDSDAAAGDIIRQGTWGDNVTFKFISNDATNNDLTFILEGTGALDVAASYTDYPWHSNNLSSKTSVIIVGEGITDLPSSSIYGDGGQVSKVAQIYLPDSLINVGEWVFFPSKKVEYINIPKNIETFDCYLTGPYAGYTFYEGETQLQKTAEALAGKTFTGAGDLILRAIPTSGTTGTCTWEIDDEGTLTVSATADGGEMADYESYGPWMYGVKDVVFVGDVTHIGAHAFAGCTGFSDVLAIPATVTSVGAGAFDNCPVRVLTAPVIAYAADTGLNQLHTVRLINSPDLWTAGNAANAPQYSSRATMETMTFANDRIPAFALYGQNLDALTITNASGDDFLGIYTAPNTKATASALTVDGTAAYIVRLTDVRGAAELLDGGINLNDVDVHWDTSPHGYATGEVDASPEVLVYPAGIHTSAPNQYAGLINAIPLIVIVAIITTIIGMMAVRRD